MENNTLEVCSDMNSKIFASQMLKRISVLTSLYNFIDKNDNGLMNKWIEQNDISEEVHENLKSGINSKIVSN